MATVTTVYGIQCNPPDGPVKFGYAKSVKERLAAIATGNPYPLKVVLQVRLPTRHRALEFEQGIHLRFQEFRLRGEWFTYSPQVSSWISSDVQGDVDRHLAASLLDQKRSVINLLERS